MGAVISTIKSMSPEGRKVLYPKSYHHLKLIPGKELKMINCFGYTYRRAILDIYQNKCW